MENRRFLSPAAMVGCGAALCLAGLLALVLSLSPPAAAAVLERDGQVLWRRELSQVEGTESVAVEGEGGVRLVVELTASGAAIVSSTCPDQTCVHTGVLTRAGESALCLPAKVSLRLEGGTPSADAVVY